MAGPWSCASCGLLSSSIMVALVVSIFCLLSASQKCVCKAARNCERAQQQMFCVQLSRSPRPRSLDLCSMAALKCANYQLEIVSEGVCASR